MDLKIKNGVLDYDAMHEALINSGISISTIDEMAPSNDPKSLIERSSQVMRDTAGRFVNNLSCKASSIGKNKNTPK